MLPTLPLAIKATTRGHDMQMGMVLAIASMRVQPRNGPSPERLAPDVALEVIQALDPAAHPGA